MVAADVVLLAPGTATLEAMLAKRPMVVGYRIAPLTHAIVKGMGMLKVDRYALPNVLAGADLAPELMQADCTPDKLAEAVLGWFRNPDSVASLQARYRDRKSTSELQSLMRISYAVFCLKKKTQKHVETTTKYMTS